MGKARQNRVNSLGLANLHNSGRLWMFHTYPWDNLGQEKFWLGVLKFNKEVVGLCRRDRLESKLFTISRN